MNKVVLQGLTQAIGVGNKHQPQGLVGVLVGAFSVVASCLLAWMALFGVTTQLMQGIIFITFMIPIGFVTSTANAKSTQLSWADLLLAILALIVGAWFIWNAHRYENWLPVFSTPTKADLVAGIALIVLSIELSRRTIGWALTAIALLFLVYTLWGSHLGGALGHGPVSLDYFIREETIMVDGIFSSPLYAVASYAFLFVLFGAFFTEAGGGQLFFDISAALTGRSVGGPSKCCVATSALYGSISGSPTADVATTGSITIPIMTKTGITPQDAGAIEAAASTGGSILPPIMGAVAFIMAQYTGIDYATIALDSILVALFYYAGIYIQVHFTAYSAGQPRLPEEQIVGLRTALLRGWTNLLPIFVLVYLLAKNYTPPYVAAGATVAVIVASWFKPSTGIGPRGFLVACKQTCVRVAPLTAAILMAGLIIGCLNMSGLIGKMGVVLSMASGGYVVASLMISAGILIILGMGMPTVSVYVLGAALLGPVLISKFDLPILTIHMFMLYYAVLSAISPPVAVACFTAGAIADANPFSIAFRAVRLAAVGFVLPFFFIYNPGLLLQGGVLQILESVLLAIPLTLAVSVMAHGYVMQHRLRYGIRTLFAALAVVVIFPILPVQIAAGVVIMALFCFYYRRAVMTPSLSVSS